MRELEKTFTKHVSPSSIAVDCDFGLGLQASDMHLMWPAVRKVVQLSELLRRASEFGPLMKHFADSLYIKTVR